MKKLLGQIKASKTALYFHSTSLGLLYVFNTFSWSVNSSGFSKFNRVARYLPYGGYKPILFLKFAGVVMLYFQLLLLFILVLSIRSTEKSSQKNIYIESCINAFTGLNIVYSLLILLQMNLILLLGKAPLIFILIISLPVTFICSYFIMTESETFSEENDDYSFKKLIIFIKNFHFPHYKGISIALFLLGSSLTFLERGFKLHSAFLFLGATIMSFGIAYYLWGSHKNFKSKDELQKRIILEQSYYKNKFIWGILFVTIIIGTSFKIKIEFVSMLWIFFPIILLSEAYIKDRYE
ncbi:MAG: hypothetical protein HYZ10_14655 [Ignavibacteriales bacterium]|nr:hypothetical protein [Ignavibacteriales bacterium]